MFYQAFLSTLSLRRATVKIGIDFIDGINFYPRSPCGERHHYLIPKIGTLHFYPRSPCGERRQIKQTCRAETSISIHALLAESDALVWCSSGGACDFYPRSPCGERRFVTAFRGSVDNFYPRSPCGERQHINSRADNVKRFLSTLSLRRATET